MSEKDKIELEKYLPLNSEEGIILTRKILCGINDVIKDVLEEEGVKREDKLYGPAIKWIVIALNMLLIEIHDKCYTHPGDQFMYLMASRIMYNCVQANEELEGDDLLKIMASNLTKLSGSFVQDREVDQSNLN